MSQIANTPDLVESRRQEARARRFWAGEGRCVASLTSGLCRPPQGASDDERVAAWRPYAEEQSKLPGLNVPSFFNDFGTVSVPRYWGGRVVVPPETGLPYIETVAATIDEALALVPRSVDDPDMDCARGLRLYRRVLDEWRAEGVWLKTTDMQGVLNTAGMVLDQTELLSAMLLEPEKVHAFLARVTDLIIALWRYQKAGCGDRLCGNVWPYTFFPCDLGISLTEDMMPLISPELYRKFGIPALRRISRAAGGLHVHCCGEWGRHAQALADPELGVRAVEFHYPFTRIEELECLADKAVFIPYIVLANQDRFSSMLDYYRHLVRETDSRFRFWFTCGDSSAETQAFVREIDEMTPAGT